MDNWGDDSEFKCDPNQDLTKVYGYPIKHLTKIDCRENVLKSLQENKIVTDKFQLNVIRINRWWWSVAFIDKSIKT